MVLGLLLALAQASRRWSSRSTRISSATRGRHVHPSTLEVMYELGLLERLLELPHPPGRAHPRASATPTSAPELQAPPDPAVSS
jgi:hypothetical protein